MARTNLLGNPSCKNNVNNWYGPTGSARITDIEGLLRTTGYAAIATGGIAMPQGAAAAGNSYTLSVYLKMVGGSGSGGCGMDWYSGGGYLSGQGGTSWNLSDGQSTRVFVTGLAPATASAMLLSISINTLTGGELQVTCGLYEQGSELKSYFDGDSGTGYAWAGTSGNSLSTGPDEEVETEAGIVHQWGTPLITDNFNDLSQWSLYDGPGHDDNGTRDPERISIVNGVMRMEGLAGGSAGGMAHGFDQTYGRWECRARWAAITPGSTGNKYHPVLIIWPASSLPPPDWPQYGEYDFVENNIGDDRPEAFIHYPHPGEVAVQQEYAEYPGPLDMSVFHNYAIEWTQDHIKGYVDGVEWYSFSDGAVEGVRSNIQDMPSGHMTIQLDNYFGAGMQPAFMEVDWVKVYDLSGTGEPVNSGKHRGFLGILLS